MEILTLERGVLLGAVLFLGGLARSIYAVTSWGHSEFGTMDPASLMRVAILSATALAAGLQVLFGSFFLAMLRIAASE